MNIGKHSAEIAVISLILTGLLFWFGIKPMVGKLHQAYLEMKVAEKEYSQKQERVEALTKIQNRLNSIKSDLEMMIKALPKGENIPDLLVSTESLVGSSGLALASFSPPTAGGGEAGGGSQTTPATTTGGSATEAEETATTTGIAPVVTQATGVASVSYSLSLKGPYSSFKTFLQNVEKNLRPTSVTSIGIAGTGGGLSYSVNLVSFYQK